MKESLYLNSKTCEPRGLSIEGVRQYYWEQGFRKAEQKFTSDNKQSEIKSQITEDILVYMSTKGHLTEEDVIFFDSIYQRLLSM